MLASIVLSGEDMMTSIHRPERCMRAQGWEFPPAIARVVDVPGHGKVPVMRLKNHKTERLKDGSTEAVENICYYWFAGYRDLTDSHLERVWFDTRDRVRTGMSQRWAMVMVAANITGLKKFGRDEAATDELLVDVVRQLAPRIHRETIAYH